VSLRYELPEDGWVTLEIFDVLGRRVRTLVDRPLRSGSHESVWDGSDQSGDRVVPGSYFVRCSASGVRASETIRWSP
jgi:flagellar hook assembly protein FlgD